MDAHSLIDPSEISALPAPLWFLLLFKVLGFTLHLVPMNLWLAGTTLAMLLRAFGGEHSRRLSGRLMKQMPVIVAYGVNLGIVPLLFVQVVYYKVFYPATILMAWAWLAIIPLLVVAYYGVYLYASGLKDNEARMTGVRHVAGWLSAIFFVVISFIFSNGLSLMANVGRWPELMAYTGVGGATTGTGLNTADPTLLPRWLMVLGLALTTTGAYLVFDTGFFARKESEAYRQRAPRIALIVYTLGALWFAAAGSWYTFGTWTADERQLMFSMPTLIPTILTAVGPAIVWLLILLAQRGVSRGIAFAVGLAQFLVLALNAASRQHLQSAKLAPYFDPKTMTVETQLSPLLVFLVLFVFGLLVVIWMLRKAATSPAPASTS
jgi:hypothetical protein